MLLTKALQPQEGSLESPMSYPNLQKGMEELTDLLRADLAQQLAASSPLHQRMAAAYVRQTCSELQLLATTNLIVQVQHYGGEDQEIDLNEVQGEFIMRSNHLYGDPEGSEPDWLADVMIGELKGPRYLENEQVDQQAVERIITAYALRVLNAGGGNLSNFCARNIEAEVIVAIKDFFDRKYGDVLAVFSVAPGLLTFIQLDELLSVAHRQLRMKNQGWTESDLAFLYQNLVSLAPGEDRNLLAYLKADQVKILYVRAMLRALRRMNARKHNDQWLERGLPGSHNAGYGLEVLVEYALTGLVPDYAVDLCIDCAWPLGMIGAQGVWPLSRERMYRVMMDKLLVRAQCRREVLDPVLQRALALDHVNTIYRGTVGDGNGVFTMGSAYLHAFEAIGSCLYDDLQDGLTIDAAMEYLLTGLFDSENPFHCDYVEQLAASSEGES